MKKETVVKENLSAPVNITWEITSKCNLSCTHCLSAVTMANCNNDLSLDQCIEFINELSRIKVFQVNIGGGEPFLREDMLGILNYCHSKGIVTCVSTNGTVLDDKISKRLSQMDLTYIQVSVDGSSSETNDKIRGNGSFAQAIKGIENLNKHGFQNLSINTVVTRTNLKQIPEMFSLGKFYKAKTRLSRFKPSGRAKQAWDEYHLIDAQVLELCNYLNEQQGMTGDSFFSISSEQRKHLALNMCGAAKMTCSLSPDGNVYPCACLQEDYLCAGSILEQSFETIWHQSLIFKQMRNLEINSCNKCLIFNMCNGGCPAVALFLRNETEYCDPQCIKHLY